MQWCRGEDSIVLAALLVVCGMFIGACDQDAPKEQAKPGIETPKVAIEYKPAPYLRANAVWRNQNSALWWFDEDHLVFEALPGRVPENIAELENRKRTLFIWNINENDPVPISTKDYDGLYCAGSSYLKFGLGAYDKAGKRVAERWEKGLEYKEMAGAWPNLEVQALPPYSERPPFFGKPGDGTWINPSVLDCKKSVINPELAGHRWVALKDGHGFLIYETLGEPWKDNRGTTRYGTAKEQKHGLNFENAWLEREGKRLDLPFKPDAGVRYHKFNDGYFVHPLRDQSSSGYLNPGGCHTAWWFWADGRTHEVCIEARSLYSKNFYASKAGVLFAVGGRKGNAGVYLWDDLSKKTVLLLKGLVRAESLVTSPNGCNVAAIHREKLTDYFSSIRVMDVCRLGDSNE